MQTLVKYCYFDFNRLFFVNFKVFLIDLDKMNEIRTNMPYLTQKRGDMYEVKAIDDEKLSSF